MKIIQIILRIIYYPIGWLGDLFDFIAGALQDIDEKIKMKIVSSEPELYWIMGISSETCNKLNIVSKGINMGWNASTLHTILTIPSLISDYSWYYVF